MRWRPVDDLPTPVQPDAAGVAAFVDIPVAESPRFAIEVTELTGGRRLFSDDRAALDAIAGLVGRVLTPSGLRTSDTTAKFEGRKSDDWRPKPSFAPSGRKSIPISSSTRSRRSVI